MKEITFSLKENLACITIFCALGFLLGVAWISHVADNVYLEGVADVPRDYYLDNIKFTMMPYEDLQDMFEVNSTLGVAWYQFNNESQNWTRVISMAYIAKEDQFLRVCNHEVMHHVFDIPNRTAEEDYIRALDDYVRFPVCERLYRAQIGQPGQ